MSIDIPSADDFARLTANRNVASVSIYVSAAVAGTGGSGNGRNTIAHDVEAVTLALRSATNDALDDLAEIDVPKSDRDAIVEHVRSLLDNRDFWRTHARTLAVFVTPDTIDAFRIMNRLQPLTAVGDRFDIGPVVRATTFPHTGFVLAVTEGDVRLLHLESDASCRKVELTTLPADAADVFGHKAAEDQGRADRQTADGTLGPKIERRRYCAIVQDAVLHEIGEDSVPLVLAAGPELAPAYREINTYKALLEEGIDANPSSLDDQDLQQRGRTVLDLHYADQLAEWRETFGTRKAQHRAGSDLESVAKAASAGVVEQLLFDIDTSDEGFIDEFGVVTPVEQAGPITYRLVDEIAARVLRTGGRVKAVRREDLPDDSPVAATFRATVE